MAATPVGNGEVFMPQHATFQIIPQRKLCSAGLWCVYIVSEVPDPLTSCTQSNSKYFQSDTVFRGQGCGSGLACCLAQGLSLGDWRKMTGDYTLLKGQLGLEGPCRGDPSLWLANWGWVFLF